MLILGAKKSAACQGTFFKEKNKFLYLTQLTHKQRGTLAESVWILVRIETPFQCAALTPH